ncbi:MAG TPA: penicillin-binding protein 2 [Acidimicrobiia bacterium]
MREANPRLRVSVIGIIVMALFSALFVRLWFLQIASGSDAAAEATTENRVRIVREPAIRGRILDAQGRVLVDNRVVDAITFDRSEIITDEQRKTVTERLAALLGQTPKQITAAIDDPRQAAYAIVPIVEDPPIETVTYIEEHQEEFPAVASRRITRREYPNGNLGAHVLGYVGQIGPEELEAVKGQGYQAGDLIGTSGVEQMFESELRGEPRVQRLEVDSRGNVTRIAEDRPSVPGKDVKLTIDLDVQRVAEESLRQGMDGAHQQTCVWNNAAGEEQSGLCRAGGGSVVVLNAQDGSVVAMASAPDFNPAELAAGDPFGTLENAGDEESGFPLLNRVVQGTYAPGSTWKPISALGGMASNHLTPQDVFFDEGCLVIGDREFCNSGKKPHGAVDLRRALTVSSDVYFYDVGRDLWEFYRQETDDLGVEPDRGYAIQQTAAEYGFGAPTGIGLAGEASGRIPDQEFKEEVNERNPDLEARRQDSRWLPGDSANLAVGQGDLLVTPLQLANAYAMIAAGGPKHTPRLASAILEPRTGNAEAPEEIVRTLAAQRIGEVAIDPFQRAAIMEGLLGAVINGDGTATASFDGLRDGTVAGKTGTAQRPPKQDTSLFVGVTPVDPGAAPQYITVSVVEEGGFGANVSAPIVRRVIDALKGDPNPPPVQVQSGASED